MINGSTNTTHLKENMENIIDIPRSIVPTSESFRMILQRRCGKVIRACTSFECKKLLFKYPKKNRYAISSCNFFFGVISTLLGGVLSSFWIPLFIGFFFILISIASDILESTDIVTAHNSRTKKGDFFQKSLNAFIFGDI